MTSGVYQITEVSTGRKYIGSSVTIEKRWYRHLWSLRHGAHPNRFLQRVFDKGGEAGLSFSVLEETADTLAREQAWILSTSPEMNLCPVAGAPMAGRKHSAETRELMSKSPEQREHLSRMMKGRPTRPCRAETKKKIRAARAAPIVCVQTGEVYQSAGEAAEYFEASGRAPSAKMARSNINAAARGAIPSAYGFTWKRME